MHLFFTPKMDFKNFAILSLLSIYLLILAGGIVRSTGSGMGCPDWPTCFGKWIPPITANQLPPDFEKYLKQQDIDHTFNVYHTWIEYINRLLGALLGIFILIHAVWSFRKFFYTKRSVFLWSLGLVVAVGFQGWLGKKVVDANLAVVKITTHMLVALLIAAIPVYIIYLVREREKVKHVCLIGLNAIRSHSLVSQKSNFLISVVNVKFNW